MTRRQSKQPISTVPPAEQTFECVHFGVCGGCSLLDQPVGWQLHDKVRACTEMLAPYLGGTSIESELPERPQQHFRTRLLYPVRSDRDRQPVVGIFEYRSHHVVPITECQTQDAWLTALGTRVAPILRTLRLEAFHAHRRRGVVKAFWARLASGTGEVLCGLVTSAGVFEDGPAFAAAMQQAAEQLPQRGRPRKLVGVVHSIRDRDDDFLLGDRHMPLRGRDHIVDRRDGCTFRISAGSFYQIHAGAHALLYRPALAMLGDVTGMRVVDGFGGVGGFGLRLAKAGARAVTIVEEGAAACRDAEHNAAANGLSQVDVQRAAFAKAKFEPDADVMVVDPPRAGLQPQGVGRVLASRPKVLLHVSCAVDALARDLEKLTAGGYRVTAMRLCDLFPHTEHVELVTRLERDA